MYKNKLKSAKEQEVDRLVDRITAPSRKRKEKLQRAGKIMTVEVDYKQYEIFRAMTDAKDQNIILNIKLRDHKPAKSKPFMGKVLLVIK